MTLAIGASSARPHALEPICALFGAWGILLGLPPTGTYLSAISLYLANGHIVALSQFLLCCD
tara:strand:- start:224 stop:409 length:186 start_codon:yes stop_codon:yes gene_type:complete